MSALDIVLAGKHSGQSHAAVADSDRGYCHWIMNASSLPRSLRSFRTWLKRTHGGVFCFGKHKNSFFSEIYRDHPEYTIWACQQTDASKALRDFQEYARRRDEEVAREEVAAEEQPQPAPKRSRGQRESEPAATQTVSMECRICYDRPIEVLLLPCTQSSPTVGCFSHMRRICGICHMRRMTYAGCIRGTYAAYAD